MGPVIKRAEREIKNIEQAGLVPVQLVLGEELYDELLAELAAVDAISRSEHGLSIPNYEALEARTYRDLPIKVIPGDSIEVIGTVNTLETE